MAIFVKIANLTIQYRPDAIIQVKTMIETRDYQMDIVNAATAHFTNSDKGIIVMPCGSGKTYTSLLIAKTLSINKIIIFTPSLILVDQWKQSVKKIFPDRIISTVCSEDEFDILITTYHNSYKIRFSNIHFALSILDECHHVSAREDISNHSFGHSLFVNTDKQLAITATFKKTTGEMPIYNDNVEFFGQIICKYSTEWAISKTIITDYEIQLCIFNEDSINSFQEISDFVQNNRLYISVLCALQLIKNGQSKHVLIYANTISNCEIIIEYVKLFIENNYFNLSNIEYFAYTSKLKPDIKIFEQAEFGIISSVYSLGEGFDLPILDTVVFSENMFSEIRITQSALRPCRLHVSKLKARIVVPILCNKDKSLPDEFSKVRKVLTGLIDNDEDYVKSRTTIMECNMPSASPEAVGEYEFTMYNKESVMAVVGNILLSKNEFKKLSKEFIFLSHNFTHGKVVHYQLETRNAFDNINYRSTILELYDYVSDRNQILSNTTFGKKVLGAGRHPDSKVAYIEHLDIFFRGVNANNAMRELIILSRKLSIDIFIEIRLYSGKVVSYAS